MEKGTLIEFKHNGERRLAVADRPEGKKNWIVIDQSGHSHVLHPRQVEYEIKGGPSKASEIEAFLREVQPWLDPSTLEVAWELLVEMGESVNAADMALILFSEQSPALCYAAHSLLSEDKFYFKRKGDLYEPRSQERVAELKHQLEMEEQRLREREGFIARLGQALAGETVVWEASDRPRFDALERLVLNPEQEVRLAQETLSMASRSASAESAFELLVDLGLWHRHENLFLRRSSHPTQFPQQVIDMAQTILVSPPADPDDRLDLTHLKLYTIDDESTREIDDGLSVETLADGKQRVWVHIADPTRYVFPEDELDKEARRRTTSLYLPTGTIPMFPMELATGPMSLVQGQNCTALSFGVVLAEDGEVEDYTIAATTVKPTYRLTYDDVDEMLELGVSAEPEIASLAHWAKVRQQWRRSQGSINIHLPESSIKVDLERDEVSIDILPDSVSRQLVAEMMILAGEVAGRYAREHDLPLPFRGQPQPELPTEEELLQLPAGFVRDCAIRGCMLRSEMGITPSRHAGLGLEVYTQVTSPIRRYVDLLGHFQLKAHLRGDDLPFSAEQVQEMTFSAANGAYEATLIERQTKRYWALEYLRRHQDKLWQALVLRWLRQDDNLGLILLEELGLELPHRFTHAVRLGDRLSVQVTAADPKNDFIRFRETIEQPQPQTATT